MKNRKHMLVDRWYLWKRSPRDQLITHTGEPDRQWQPAAGPERSDSSSQVATKPTQQYSSGSSSATTNDGAVDLAEPSSVTATGVCEVTGLSEVRLLASASQEPVTQRRNRKSKPNQAVVSTTVTVSSFLAESYNASDKVYYAPQLDDRLLSLDDLELLELEPEVELTIERTDRYEYGDTASDDHDDEHTEDDDEVSGTADNLKSDTTQYFHQYHNNNNGDTFHHQTFLVDGPHESGDGAGRGEKQPPPPDLACLPGPGQVLHQQPHQEHAVYVSRQDRNKFCGSLPNHLDLDVSAIGDRDCEAIVNRQNEFLQANLKNVQQHQKQTVIHLGQTNAHDLQLTFAGTGHFLPQLAPYQQIAPVEPGSTFRSANAPEPTSQSQHHHPAPALASIQQKLLLHRTVVDAGCDQGYGSERSPEDELPPPLLLLHDRQYLKMLPSSNSSIGLAPDGPSVETSGTSSAPGSSDTSAGGGDGFAQPQKCWATLNATGQLAGGPYSFITKDTIFSVQVSKSTRGLGLSVSGGSDSNAPFAGLIRIKRLFPHQAAWATGMLQPGDIILEANGVPLTGLTNYHALEILRQTTSVVTLTVCRPKDKQYRKLSPPTEPPKPPLRNALSNEPGLGSGSVPPSPVPTGVAFQQQQQQQHHQLMQHFFPTSSIGYEPPFLPPLDPLHIGFNGEFEIVLTKQQGSLGFTLRKEDESVLGHYVRALVREPALSDGRIRPGDKIVAVNDVPISTMTHEEAVIFLRQAADVVHLRLYRDQAQTPISAQSPTDSSCSGQRKVRLRPEALNLLTDLAASRSHQVAVGSGSQVALSNMSTPRRLRRVGAHHSGLDRLGFQEQQQDSNDIFNYFDICSNASTIVSQADNFDEAYYFDDEIDALIADEGPTGTTVQQLNKDGGQHGEEASAFVSLPCETLLVACKTEQNLHSTDQTEAIYVQHFAHKSPLYSSLNVPATAQPDELAEAVVRGGKISLMKWKGKMLQMAAGEEEDKMSVATRSLEHPPLPTPEGNGFSLSVTEERDLAPSEGVLDLTAHMGVDIDGNKLFFVELNKGWNSRLGFSLKQQECPDGKNRTIISAIYRDSVAARNGRLHVGDVLLTVNEESVESLPTAQVIELLRIVRGPIFITLMRPRVPSNDILEPTPAEPKEIDELDADAAKALSTLQVALYPEDGAAPVAAVEGTEDAKKDCE
ncbi:uncharacterized protein LOC128728533 [Anopheles nili]|uniref:uncharacterized protein LOC128728533 n=1 Tax=Anopheles nili TaxID=185578 RepID=UPI00237AEB51|nr:uncharacterized protein LOC128728533 [Anopheles nili]